LRDLYYVNDLVLDFIEDDTIKNLPFTPILSKMQQDQLRKLASHYNLKSSYVGSGKNKMVNLSKTNKTFLLPDEEITDMLAAIMVKPKNGTPENKDDLKRTNRKKHKTKPDQQENSPKKSRPNGKRPQRSNRSSPQRSSPKRSSPKSPGIVGQEASPIDESNVGNRLLRSMGWTPGTPLGATGEGIVDPISAIIKHNKKGIGYM